MLTGNRYPDSIGLIKIKTTGLILALCFFGAALCFADDPHMSNANPNESKSKVTPGTEKIKPTYISLVQFTDKGIQGAKQTTQRVAAWAAKVQSMGRLVSTTRCAFSRPRTMRPLPVCCWQRTCWVTSARRRCALSQPPRWTRSWPRCPDSAMTNDAR